jgi:hypothetical protein
MDLPAALCRGRRGGGGPGEAVDGDPMTMVDGGGDCCCLSQ